MSITGPNDPFAVPPFDCVQTVAALTTTDVEQTVDGEALDADITTVARLTDQDIDRIARRVVELLEPTLTVDTRALAERIQRLDAEAQLHRPLG